jgi:hypothetical protein
MKAGAAKRGGRTRKAGPDEAGALANCQKAIPSVSVRKAGAAESASRAGTAAIARTEMEMKRTQGGAGTATSRKRTAEGVSESHAGKRTNLHRLLPPEGERSSMCVPKYKIVFRSQDKFGLLFNDDCPR